MIDQDIQDGIQAAREYAELLPKKLTVLQGACGYARAEEVREELRLVYRMAAELRRQTDSLARLMEKREAGR